jgi:hypothetical protein
MDMKKRIHRLYERRYDPAANNITLSSIMDKLSLSDTEKYLIGSMEPVSSQQSDIVINTGERIKNQLESYLNNNGLYPHFDFQGSVTNNTHIKFNSDIDLIVVSNDFINCIEGAFASLPTYFGDAVQTIFTLRSKCRDGLKSKFPAATVKEKAKCVGISGGSLQRNVDVVPCSWVKNRDYERTRLKMYLGIRVLDVEKNARIDNFPFLHNAMLELKDNKTDGNLKRIIRLLKTLKEDASTTIDISSYDICGLAYSFDYSSMMSTFYAGQFDLLERFLSYSQKLETNLIRQMSISVPNGTRFLFSTDGLKVSELKKLNAELNEVLDDVRPTYARGLTATPHSAYALYQLLNGK